MNRNNLKSGFSLVEMLVYITILAIMLVLIIQITTSIVISQRSIRSQRNIDNSAITGFERIIREVRLARTINITSSVFGTHPGVLVLEGEDDLGTARTVEFYLTDGQIMMEENGSLVGSVTQPSADVSELIFTSFGSPIVSGVRVSAEIESGTSTHYRVNTFYTSASIR